MNESQTVRSKMTRLILNKTGKTSYLQHHSDESLDNSTILCTSINGITQQIISTLKLEDWQNGSIELVRDDIEGSYLEGGWEAIINFQVISPYVHDRFRIVSD